MLTPVSRSSFSALSQHQQSVPADRASTSAPDQAELKAHESPDWAHLASSPSSGLESHAAKVAMELDSIKNYCWITKPTESGVSAPRREMEYTGLRLSLMSRCKLEHFSSGNFPRSAFEQRVNDSLRGMLRDSGSLVHRMAEDLRCARQSDDPRMRGSYDEFMRSLHCLRGGIETLVQRAAEIVPGFTLAPDCAAMVADLFGEAGPGARQDAQTSG